MTALIPCGCTTTVECADHAELSLRDLLHARWDLDRPTRWEQSDGHGDAYTDH